MATTRTGISSGLSIRKGNAASVFRARFSPPPMIGDGLSGVRGELVSSYAAGLEAAREGDVDSAGKDAAALIALDQGSGRV